MATFLLSAASRAEPQSSTSWQEGATDFLHSALVLVVAPRAGYFPGAAGVTRCMEALSSGVHGSTTAHTETP